MSPVLIWFVMAVLLLAGLWSSNYLLPMLRLVRSYWHSPLILPHAPRALTFSLFLTLTALNLKPVIPHNGPSAGSHFQEAIDSEVARQGYAYFEALKQSGLLRLDARVYYHHIRPEIAYALASILSVVQEESGARHLIVSSVNDRNHTRNSYHYRNLAVDLPMARLGVTSRQGVRIVKKLNARLGPGYRVIYGSEGHIRHMHVQYEGPSWNAEKILALPLLEAASLEQVEPACLMAWAKVASGFDPHYDDQRGRAGLLALRLSDFSAVQNGDSTDFKAYLRAGARLLRAQLELYQNDTARAWVAIRTNGQYRAQESANWWKDPQLASWVDQILLETKNYRHQFNGTSWSEDLIRSSDSLPSEPSSVRADAAMPVRVRRVGR